MKTKTYYQTKPKTYSDKKSSKEFDWLGGHLQVAAVALNQNKVYQ
jgi:hypothetical protein